VSAAGRHAASSRAAIVLAALLLAGCAELPLASDRDAGREPKPPSGALNEAVTQANVRRTICSPAWTAGVRPPAPFIAETKARLLKEAGIAPAEAAKYELDFLVPLSLGGHPRKPENLWLQPVDGAWGARTKDRLEAKLRRLVCSGEVPLREARDAIRSDWKMAARYYLSDRELLGPVD
jgi:hypothetical protein